MAFMIEYLLRRAERETVEAIRADHPGAAASHAKMAALYGARARSLLARPALQRQVENAPAA